MIPKSPQVWLFYILIYFKRYNVVVKVWLILLFVLEFDIITFKSFSITKKCQLKFFLVWAKNPLTENQGLDVCIN